MSLRLCIASCVLPQIRDAVSILVPVVTEAIDAIRYTTPAQDGVNEDCDKGGSICDQSGSHGETSASISHAGIKEPFDGALSVATASTELAGNRQRGWVSPAASPANLGGRRAETRQVELARVLGFAVFEPTSSFEAAARGAAAGRRLRWLQSHVEAVCPPRPPCDFEFDAVIDEGAGAAHT